MAKSRGSSAVPGSILARRVTLGNRPRTSQDPFSINSLAVQQVPDQLRKKAIAEPGRRFCEQQLLEEASASAAFCDFVGFLCVPNCATCAFDCGSDLGHQRRACQHGNGSRDVSPVGRLTARAGGLGQSSQIKSDSVICYPRCSVALAAFCCRPLKQRTGRHECFR